MNTRRQGVRANHHGRGHHLGRRDDRSSLRQRGSTLRRRRRHQRLAVRPVVRSVRDPDPQGRQRRCRVQGVRGGPVITVVTKSPRRVSEETISAAQQLAVRCGDVYGGVVTSKVWRSPRILTTYSYRASS
jgi:hypothetical protein